MNDLILNLNISIKKKVKYLKEVIPYFIHSNRGTSPTEPNLFVYQLELFYVSTNDNNLTLEIYSQNNLKLLFTLKFDYQHDYTNFLSLLLNAIDKTVIKQRMCRDLNIKYINWLNESCILNDLNETLNSTDISQLIIENNSIENHLKPSIFVLTNDTILLFNEIPKTSDELLLKSYAKFNLLQTRFIKFKYQSMNNNYFLIRYATPTNGIESRLFFSQSSSYIDRLIKVSFCQLNMLIEDVKQIDFG